MAILAKYETTLVDAVLIAIEIDVSISVARITDCFAEIEGSTVFQKKECRSVRTSLTGSH